MSVLAIIPARGGSKGIPGKNLRRLGGHPLVAVTVGQALAATTVDRVVVTTDDPAIAAAARDAGGEVVDRPAALAGDEEPSESALVHCLDTLKADGYEPTLVVFLQCTSPLRRPGDIDAAVAQLRNEDADSLFSAVPFHGFLWRPDEDGWSAANYDPARRPRRQERPLEALENGSIYVFRPMALARWGHRLGGRVACYLMDRHSAVDIDEPDDLELAAALLPRYETPEPADDGRTRGDL